MSGIQSKYNKAAVLKEAATTAVGIQLANELVSAGRLTPPSESISRVLISNESFSPAEESQAHAMTTSLADAIGQFFIAQPKVAGREVTDQQKQAVQFALLSAQNPSASLRRTGNVNQFKATNGLEVFIPDTTGLDPSKLGQRSLEAYDTKPNQEMLEFTAAYALATATQNRFTEMFFKTVNLGPDQYAVEMEIPLISVHDEVRYELEKRLTDFNMKMIVNAEIDHTILKNDTLKITPVVRAETVDAFVDPALVAPAVVVLESGESVSTAPLKVNHRGSLFRVAQTDAELAKGTLNQTDALDPGAILKGVYVQFGEDDAAEVVRFDTTNMPTNQFTDAAQGMTRLMQLNFATDAATISNSTTLHNGATSTLLAAFQGPTANTAFLTFSLRGDVNLQNSAYEIIAGSVYANTVKNAQGQVIDLDAPANAAMKALFDEAKVIAFDLDISKVNSNLRELGQLADFNTYRQVYGVALGSPLAVQRPITNGDQQDALHAAALSYMCKVRQSNVGITHLLSEIDTLRQYRKRTNIVGRQPEVMGISSYLVEPTLVEANVDLSVAVTSTAQHQRNADIRAILTDTCQIVGYKLWQQSNWQAAANLLEGTEATGPVIKVGTDMVLTQYLMIEGDTRTLGPDFKYEKAWTMDARMKDKIIIALGYQSDTPGVPHPLDHGMMINKPEVVAALNLSRGSHSRELIVHPSFRHITLCPILGVVNVTGLVPALTEKAVLGVSVTNAADFPA